MVPLFKKLDPIFGIDIRALALMRMVFPFLIFIDILSDFPYLKTFYSNEGLLPNSYALQTLHNGTFSLFLLNNSWGFHASLIALLMIACITLMAGLYTRLSTFTVWLLLCSLHNRNWFILGAEDKLLHILFFWFMFLPWGACWSLDRKRNPNPPPLRFCSVATAAYLLQIGFFYSFAGFIKIDAEWTQFKSAAYLILSIHQFVKPFGESLLAYPAFLEFATTAALQFERFGPFFLFSPFKTNTVRVIAIACFVVFHLGIMVCLELKYFQWICLALFIGFIPTSLLDKIIPRPTSISVTRGQSKILNLIVAFFIAYVLLWNLSTIKIRPFKNFHQLDWIGHTLNIRQYWGMFGPGVMRDDGWFVIPGRLRNGQAVDVFSGNTPISWDEPPSIQALNKNYHLTLYYLNIHHPHNIKYVSPWGRYLCHEWNKAHPPEEQLSYLHIIYMQRTLLLGYQEPVIQKKPILLQPCVDADEQYQKDLLSNSLLK